jgi:uncharacterized protein YbjT (DUF2867 family)
VNGVPSDRILVIGGTGNVGRHVVDELHGAGVPVRVMSRNPEGAGLPAGVELVRGDVTSPETLDRALDQIDTVFLVWVAPPATAAAAVEGIARRARRIVFLTAPLKTPHPFFQQPNPSRGIAEHLERLIETSGVGWTFVRSGMFAGNARHFWGAQIRSGDVVRWPYLSAPTAPTDERDVAAVAVRALRDDRHDRAEYVVTGPQSLTQAEQIDTIGRAIGRTLRVEELSPAEAQTALLPVLGSPAVIAMLLDAWSAALGQPAYVTSTCRDITGRPARAFLEWAADHAAAFV